MVKKNNTKEIKFEQPSEILLLANRYVMLVVGIIVLSVLIGGYLFLLKPKIDSIKSVQVEDKETEERRQQNQQLLDSIKKLDAEYTAIKEERTEDLEMLKKMVPADPQIAELFVTSNYLAEKNYFELVSLEISESVDEGGGHVQAVTTVNPEVEDTGIDEVELQTNYNKDIDLSTSLRSLVLHVTVSFTDGQLDEDDNEIDPYNAFKKYLTDLETHLRLIDVQTVSFDEFTPAEPADERQGEDEEGQAVERTFSFDLITYYR